MRLSFSSAQTKDHEAKECIQGQEKKRKKKKTNTHRRKLGWFPEKERKHDSKRDNHQKSKME
jgi:hypothetical protein